MTTSDTQILFSLVAEQRSPVGAVVNSSGQLAEENRFGFSTRYFDLETGIGKWPQRDYLPAINRWMSRDRLGERGGRNLYGFVGNRPMQAVDLFGTWWTDLNFLLHFLFGGGDSVNLSDVGLQAAYISSSSVQDVVQLSRDDIQQTVDTYKGCCVKDEYFFFGPVDKPVQIATIWVLSNGHLEYSGRCDCNDKQAFYCVTTFYGTDEIKDPFSKDVWEEHGVEWPDWVDENFGGTPFFVYVVWQEAKQYQ